MGVLVAAHNSCAAFQRDVGRVFAHHRFELLRMLETGVPVPIATLIAFRMALAGAPRPVSALTWAAIEAPRAVVVAPVEAELSAVAREVMTCRSWSHSN